MRHSSVALSKAKEASAGQNDQHVDSGFVTVSVLSRSTLAASYASTPIGLEVDVEAGHTIVELDPEKVEEVANFLFERFLPAGYPVDRVEQLREWPKTPGTTPTPRKGSSPSPASGSPRILFGGPATSNEERTPPAIDSRIAPLTVVRDEVVTWKLSVTYKSFEVQMKVKGQPFAELLASGMRASISQYRLSQSVRVALRSFSVTDLSVPADALYIPPPYITPQKKTSRSTSSHSPSSYRIPLKSMTVSEFVQEDEDELLQVGCAQICAPAHIPSALCLAALCVLPALHMT